MRQHNRQFHIAGAGSEEDKKRNQHEDVLGIVELKRPNRKEGANTLNADCVDVDIGLDISEVSLTLLNPTID